MSKLFNKIILKGLFLFILMFPACSTNKTQNIQLPEKKPSDFNFIFNYGVNAKNQLDTTIGQFTRDMITKPSITTSLKLSDEEMNTIYLEMRKINILNYPENFEPKSNTMQKPFDTYFIKVIVNSKGKTIFWKDVNTSNDNDAIELRKLFRKIQDIIINKEEFKKLPKPKGGYL